MEKGFQTGIHMKVRNISVYMGEQVRGTEGPNAQKEGQQVKKGAIYGGSLTQLCDPVEQKRQQAKQRAMKIVGDVWKNEQKIDDDLAARKEKVRELLQEQGEYRREIGALEEERALLKEQYGVKDDSEEQRELELLEKELDAQISSKRITLTKEEYEQIAKIKQRGLTEYQSRMLEKKEACFGYELRIEKIEKEVRIENAIISGVKLERLKSNPMGEAIDQAEAVQKAASEEILGMLVEEGQEHIEEEMQEKKETAEKKKEKEEIQEEKLEHIKEKKKQQEELSEDILKTMEELINLDSKQSTVQKELKDMMSSLKVLEEDIKGAKIDKEV